MNNITHLIPATEFIRQYDSPSTYETSELDRVANEIYNYAQFLRQPLQEWMFVGEDRLFDDDLKWNESFKHYCVEFLIELFDLKLTPKALEQIYGAHS